jgi:hypothetical protein
MNIVKRQVMSQEHQCKRLGLDLPAPLQKSYWRTQNGEMLFPQEFETKHLNNTIKWIEKNALHFFSIDNDTKIKRPDEYVKQSPIYQLLVKESEERKKPKPKINPVETKIIPRFLR